MNDLEQIIKGCVKGDRRAQQHLYQLYADKMFGVCMRYCKDVNEASECLQEGFIKVFEKIETYGHKGSFEGWVRRIIVNKVIERFRKKRYELPVDEFPTIADELPEEEEVPILNQAELLELIQGLPPQYQMVFNLYAMEGYSHKDISEELGISVGTSKSNLARARQWLMIRIKEQVKGKNKIVC